MWLADTLVVITHFDNLLGSKWKYKIGLVLKMEVTLDKNISTACKWQ